MALHSARLNRVVKATKGEMDFWSEGVSLERDSGTTIAALAQDGAVARWRLARSCKRTADRLASLSKPHYRSAISRYYYSMYHAMRSVVYVSHGGDDHEEHSKLPGHVPSDFPDQTWQTRLKNARLTRNAADYDPYPVQAAYWAARARTMKAEATSLLAIAKAYLRTKGCAP